MKMKLGENSYGKNAINLSKVTRQGDYHEFRHISVNVILSGDFESAHTEGDNRSILPTDTQKNTVYALAKEHFVSSIEEFGLYLSDYFLSNNQPVTTAKIEITEHLYNRMVFDEVAHPHSFTGSSEKRTAVITRNEESVEISAGIKGLLLVKTTDSGFENYIKDKYTTLKETNDRILATECEANWTYNVNSLDFTNTFRYIRTLLLQTFAAHLSLSLQHTMYAMGEEVLNMNDDVKEISFKMPNKHHILFNLEQFDMENKNEIFVATDEPYGYITGTVVREE